MPAFLLVTLFIGFSAWILLDHEFRFFFELDTAFLIPWASSNSLLALVLLFIVIIAGSMADHSLLQEGPSRRPLLALVMSLLMLGFSCLGLGVFLTTTHYTWAHDNFYITAIVISVLMLVLWFWGRTRLWYRETPYFRKDTGL